MNNIYVDELPKSCKECGHTIYWDIDDVFVCSLNNRDREHLEGDDYKKGLKLNSCPLKPLSDRLTEERKKVCDELRRKAEDKYFEIGEYGEVPCGWVISEERLQQVERGTDD